jgi:hypothetical protein
MTDIFNIGSYNHLDGAYEWRLCNFQTNQLSVVEPVASMLSAAGFTISCRMVDYQKIITSILYFSLIYIISLK